MSFKLDVPSKVSIVEVGPRDGLQNEKTPLSVSDKVKLIDALSDTGLRRIEAGSFVSPKWVPQMANSHEVLTKIKRKTGVVYSALTPNSRGFEDAISADADEVAVFGAASESFSQKNINCSIAESIDRFIPLIQAATSKGIPVRAYVSCILGCPYEGEIDAEAVLDISKTLLDLGCYEVSLGDTIGVGTPLKTQKLLNLLISQLPVEKLAMHMHDTYGQALANVLIGLQNGVQCFDSSVAGLGGCPYAQGASGNLASEDLVYMLSNMHIETGIDLNKLINVGHDISVRLDRANGSKVGKALKA
uniref:hydroxymethylglutaryl-CoA lyase n=1 Tax=Ningiella ruwaisensis TaxID=2364274 RepID=UPI00109F2A5A|nr:hydroxymethylglutaryl-CoA lyase [Ningiella ruwaisensis]